MAERSRPGAAVMLQPPQPKEAPVGLIITIVLAVGGDRVRRARLVMARSLADKVDPTSNNSGEASTRTGQEIPVRCTAEIFGPVRVLASPLLLLVGSTLSGSCEPYQASPPNTIATTARTMVMMRPHRGFFGLGGLTYRGGAWPGPLCHGGDCWVGTCWVGCC